MHEDNLHSYISLLQLCWTRLSPSPSKRLLATYLMPCQRVPFGPRLRRVLSARQLAEITA